MSLNLWMAEGIPAALAGSRPPAHHGESSGFGTAQVPMIMRNAELSGPSAPPATGTTRSRLASMTWAASAAQLTSGWTDARTRSSAELRASPHAEQQALDVTQGADAVRRHVGVTTPTVTQRHSGSSQ